MAHITLAQQGLDAVYQRDWEPALAKLTEALKSSLNPLWLIGRSKALIGTKRYNEALYDAELAWHSAVQRNKRELVIEANYRRAVAYNRLGECGNAVACCAYAMRLTKKENTSLLAKVDPKEELLDENGNCKMTHAEAKEEMKNDPYSNRPKDSMEEPTESMKSWRLMSTLKIQALYKVENLPPDSPARKITTTQKPPKNELSDHSLSGTSAAPNASPSNDKTVGEGPVQDSTAGPSKPKPSVPADTPVRLQDFQSDKIMTVSIFSKGVDKSKLKVEFLPHAVHLDPINYPNGDAREYKIDLWGEIDTTDSRYNVTPSKVELSLKKKVPGKWSYLRSESAHKSEDMTTQEEVDTEAQIEAIQASYAEEYAKDIKSLNKSEFTTEEKADEPEPSDKGKGKAVDDSATNPPAAAGASYPTSSRSGPKDWDKLAEADSEEEDSDVNLFFKKIFKNATPEQQRAMVKSFTESNGTSLSTDWDDVKERTVQTVPPDGVEAKKWEQA